MPYDHYQKSQTTKKFLLREDELVNIANLQGGKTKI